MSVATVVSAKIRIPAPHLKVFSTWCHNMLAFSTLQHFISHKYLMIYFIVFLIGAYIGMCLSKVNSAAGVLGISLPVCG